MPHPQAAPGALVIEDNPALLALLTQLLTHEGFQAEGASDAATGLRTAIAQRPALVILDVGLPDGNGLTLAAELRRRGVQCPILMLTAHDAVHERVAGLDAGADDYLVKPFDTEELVARVRALLRRTGRPVEGGVQRVGDLTLDVVHRVVRRGDETIPLTQREYSLLAILMRHAGQPVSREALAAEAWQQQQQQGVPNTNIVDVYIAYLRRKLERPGAPPLLHTVRGVGYVLRADRTEPEDAPGARAASSDRR